MTATIATPDEDLLRTDSAPALCIQAQRECLFAYQFEDLALENYQHHPAIRAAVAV